MYIILLYPLEASSGYFGLVFATPLPRIEIFGINVLRGKLHQLGSQICRISSLGVSFSGTETSLILKNKMAATSFLWKVYTFFYQLFLIGRRLNLFIGDMYNRYTCPLQPCRHLTLKLLIQGHPRSAKVTHIADIKSPYISLIIGPRGLQCETNL